jgi:hypothetical protein
MSSVYEFLDISEDEATQALEKVDKYGNRDGRICICGHSLKFHSFLESRGVHVCNALKQACPCKNPRVVVESSNTRVFMRKTHGGGALHALTQGIVKASQAGATVEWVVDQRCDRCETEGPVAPVPVNSEGKTQSDATGYDALLCRSCREQV